MGRTKTTACVLLGLIAAVAASPMAGCRGDRTDAPPRRFFPDMDDQPKWDAQEKTAFFEDGRTLRRPPANTVAFGAADFDPAAHADEPWASGLLRQRDAYLAEDDAVYLGVVSGPDGGEVYVDEIPIEVTEDLIRLGREQFDIYCSACHGYLGDGKGTVGVRWAYAPANLLADQYRDKSQQLGKDGYLYHVTREGLWNEATGANRMPGYKHALDEHEAWAVVAYIRALQRSQRASVEDLTAGERDRLERVRGAAAGEEGAQP